ncbi:MAG: c-type cytochrome domain-containing protein, partial [Pirellulaceae bacterium]
MSYRSSLALSSLMLVLQALPPCCRAGELTGDSTLAFETEIRSILRAHCFDCHGATTEIEGELDLRLVRFMIQGGQSGPAIHPGNADGSLLIERVSSGEMPPGEQKVTPEELEKLRRWIDGGAMT